MSIRVFLIDIYLIPSSSMENTLYPDDVIFVNKLTYGPKLPVSPYEIPWINIFYYLKDNSKEAIQQKPWKAKRLPGTSTMKQGDVVVFKNFKKDIVFVKRCVAIAGDTLKIVDGDIYTNHKLYHAPEHIRNTYAFKIKHPKAFYTTIDSLGIDTHFYSLKSDKYWKEAELSYLETEKLKDLNCIDSLRKNPDVYILNPKNIFPYPYKDKQWTLDNYGTIVIPKTGMQLQLTDITFKIYRGTINGYENVKITKKENVFFLNGKIITSYTFKKNYYFMMGDHRKNSRDSRYFGFVPEDKIIGKATCVLFSNKEDRFQWNRLFKGL